MTPMPNQNPVFIPGPTNIPQRLLQAMQVPTLDHRAPDFVQVFAPVLEDTARVFGTESGQVILFPSSGTGGWEAAITNTLSPGDRVLIGRYGMFSQRWIDMCERHGLDVQVVECRWGQGAPIADFQRILTGDTGHTIKAVLVTHNETATGVMTDMAAVRAAMDASSHPAMLFVDCVSSLASVPFEFDAWGVDIAISGSQKGFMLSAGMAVLCVSDKAQGAMAGATLNRCYFDFRDMIGANAKGGFPYTPPLQHIFGLRAALDMLFEEGLENVYARHARLARATRRAVAAWGLKLVAETPDLYSDTVTAIYTPEGFDAGALIDHAYAEYGVSFGAGLGQLAGRAFRIGHLGSLTPTMLLSGLATIEMAMADLGYPITLGSGVAAAQDDLRSAPAAASAAA